MPGKIASTLGMRGLESSRRFDLARNPMTAISNLERFCWVAIEPSIEIKTSNSLCARVSRLPFFNPAQPIKGTDRASCPGRNRCKRQLRFSSSKIRTSGVSKNLRLHLFQNCKHLFPLHAGKSVQKNFDGIACFESHADDNHWLLDSISDGRAARCKASLMARVTPSVLPFQINLLCV